MDIISGLWNGFAVALVPINLWWCFVGVFLGTVVGVMWNYIASKSITWGSR